MDGVNVSTNEASGSIVQFLDDDNANYPYRFYRTSLFDASSGARVGTLTRLQPNRMTFELATLPNRSYVLQGSTHLVTWSDLSSHIASGLVLGITNTVDLSIPFRFFRVQSHP